MPLKMGVSFVEKISVSIIFILFYHFEATKMFEK